MSAGAEVKSAAPGNIIEFPLAVGPWKRPPLLSEVCAGMVDHLQLQAQLREDGGNAEAAKDLRDAALLLRGAVERYTREWEAFKGEVGRN